MMTQADRNTEMRRDQEQDAELARLFRSERCTALRQLGKAQALAWNALALEEQAKFLAQVQRMEAGRG